MTKTLPCRADFATMNSSLTEAKYERRPECDNDAHRAYWYRQWKNNHCHDQNLWPIRQTERYALENAGRFIMTNPRQSSKLPAVTKHVETPQKLIKYGISQWVSNIGI